ncbi:putative 40S ribosomal protein S19-binding protein 1 [Trichinella spiralis]|uniref:putative 40S ribosomal protein S19-binding protein 1 n=1 Tax=Trichinella spiralis TaxID=6334 RepID=UPI0001EFE357|nr:putative 40S ribosomal protein S19-binding protein 1 [Trichinella spiralis]
MLREWAKGEEKTRANNEQCSRDAVAETKCVLDFKSQTRKQILHNQTTPIMHEEIGKTRIEKQKKKKKKKKKVNDIILGLGVQRNNNLHCSISRQQWKNLFQFLSH